MTRGPPALGFGVELTTLHRKKKINYLLKSLKNLGPGKILWINYPSNGIRKLYLHYGM
jgi:hypothetical protein